jgi:hypothetical protein
LLQLLMDPKRGRPARTVSSLLCFSLALGFLLADTRSVSAAPIPAPGTFALPAFARKYSMPCSACHDSWPRLSPFGQAFKDNGYQLMNEKDSPIYQNPGYWPVTFRITPNWHVERTNRNQVDGTPNPNEVGITTHGFDWSGLDFHTAGTLAKNVSFYVLPSSDSTGAFHFESVWARLDNMFGSSWLNIKLGKFELDNLQSEKRILTLSSTGGLYQNYHFQPLVSPGSPAAPGAVGESVYGFGLGDNQVGIEWLGHSKDDRTRISASLLTSNDGSPGLTSNNGGGVASGGSVTGNTYDGYFAASQAFQVGDLGLQRVGGFAYIGQAPTICKFTLGGPCVDGTGAGNKLFYRAGFIGQFFIKQFDVTTMYFRGYDNVALTEAGPGVGPLVGARSPSWNGALIEPHYTVSPRLVFTGRYELIRMSQQVLASNPSNFGDIDAGVIGYRFYPFISSRAGFAFHNEFAIVRQRGAAPVSGKDLTSGSVLIGFDFDF